MGSVLYSNNPTEWKLTDAVVIDEQDQPSAPKFSGVQRVIHMVGEFPWGDPDTLITIKTAKQLKEKLFGECTDLPNYGGYKALVGKQWGPMEIVRVEAADAAAATRTLDDTTNDSYVVTAKYKTAAGNQISVKHTNVSGSVFDVEIKWGTKTESFKGVAYDAGGMASIPSEWVTFALDGAGGANPASDSDFVALAGGSNGTLVDLNWTGSDVSPQGLQVLRSGTDGGIWLAAEFTSAAWITSLRTAIGIKLSHGMVQAAAGDGFTANETAAGAISDERLFIAGHRVLQTIDGTQYTVDLAPFAASIYVNSSPNLSIAEDRWFKLLIAIDGLPDGVELSREFWISADVVGMNMLERRDAGGFRFHMAITSDPASGKTSFLRRRMTDFINANIAAALQPFRNRAPVPTYRRGAKLAQTQKLNLMIGTDDVPDSQMVENFSVVETVASSDSIEFAVKAKLYGEMRYLIAHVTVGENVIIEEVA